MCADTQETVDEWRVSVEKLKPVDLGSYQLAIGGAGNGDLVDGFSERLTDIVTSWQAGLTDIDIKRRVAAVLIDYNNREVAAYPFDPGDDRVMDFLCCIRRKPGGKVFLWKLSGTAMTTVTEYELIGAGLAVYKDQVKCLYRPNAPMLRSVLLGLWIIQMAKRIHSYIGLQTQVVGFRDTSMWSEKIVRVYEDHVHPMCWFHTVDQIEKYETRLERFHSLTANVLLDSADTTISSVDFAAQAEQLKIALTDLHREYTQNANRESMIHFYKGNLPTPYPTCAVEAIPHDEELRRLASGKKRVRATKPPTVT